VTQSPQKPNVVFFMVDQLSARWLEAAEAGACPVPNLERLKRRGVTFRHCYSSNPVCQPARATLATGLTSRQHGVLQNGYRLDASLWNFMRALQQAGWRTGSHGKIHFLPHWEKIRPEYDGFGWDVIHHTEDLRAGDWLDWIEAEHPQHYDTALALTRAPWIPEFAAYGPEKRDLQKRIHEILETFEWAKPDFPADTDFAYTFPMPAELSQTEWITRHAERFIRETPAGTPLYAHVSYVQPHSPYCPPGEYMHAVDPSKLPPIAPPEWLEADPHAPAYFRRQKCEPGDWMLRRHYYFADIAHLDAQLGRVMDALDAAGRTDDTYLVFLSDHGEMLGDHGFHQKEERHYDACIRVPLIIAGPDVSGGTTREEIVQLEDLAPTVLDMAGLPQPRYENRMSTYLRQGFDEVPTLPGRSLLPLCLGEPVAGWREDAYVESYNAIWSVDPQDWARTLRTRDWRYTFYPCQGGEQLFNVTEDPQEQHNLVADPACATLRRELRDRLTERIVLQDYPLTSRQLFGIGLH